jgi:hypothetical protein
MAYGNCNHRYLHGAHSLEAIYTPDNREHTRCKRCGTVWRLALVNARRIVLR